LSLFKSLFRRKPDEGYKTADVYSGLREQILRLTPLAIGLTPSGSNRVWGMLMETGYPEAVATLVALGDGTVSLYFSNGGAIIGVGQHEGPRQSCEAFLAAAPSFLQYAKPTNDYPLPKKSHTRFYFLTYDGIFTAEAPENDLGYKRHPLSPLFHKAHEVITQARLVDESLRGQDNSAPGGRSQV
jgi:hypothetical protein